jgi:hypothetical protein
MSQTTNTGSNGKGMATAALVLGILAVTCCCCTKLFAILAIVFGFCAKSAMKRTGNYDGSAMATAGIVLGIFSLVMVVIAVLAWLAMIFFWPCALAGLAAMAHM